MIPICGRGTPWLAPRLSNVPIWAFHNDEDPRVSVEHSEQMVQAVNTAGGSAKLTVYEGSGHDAWTRAYTEPDLQGWLLAQHK
jgi:predicted peptidase